MKTNIVQQIVLALIFLTCFIACLLLLISKQTSQDSFMPALIERKEKVQVLPDILKGVKTIACIGDSITFNNGDGRGFPKRLKMYLNVLFPKQKIEVLNKGVGGEHAFQMLNRFDKDAIETKADLIIILAGVNDVGHRYSSDHPAGDNPMGSSLEKYLSSMKAMIEKAKKAKRSVVLVTPPTIFEDPENSANKMLGQYAKALKELAQDENVPLADVREAYVKIPQAYRKTCNASDYLLTKDGVHPNSLGNKVITECILSTLGISSLARRHIRK